MEKATYRIVLADGTSVDTLRLNGNNFISETEITESTFAGSLSTVTVEGPNGSKTFHDMKLVQISKEGKEWWFILAEKSEQEKMFQKLETTTDDIILIIADMIGGN